MRRRILYSVALATALSAVALSSSVLPGAAEPTISGTPGSALSRPVTPQQPSTCMAFNVWTMRADGSDQVNLTQGDDSHWSWMPAWSPDGTKIAYASWQGEDIFVMNADGSDPIDVTNSPASYEGEPTWSPDGRKIAFVCVSGPWESQALCVINAAPSWSPDGRKIAFERFVERTANDEIFVINADGSGLTQLTHGLGDHPRPAWSPDGTRITRFDLTR